VVVCAVPWARHRSRFTRPFEDQTAWLAVNTSKKATAELMRIAWRTVGAIITRVWMDIDSLGDRLDGVRRIGIDEIFTNAATATSPSWSATTPDGWYGPRRVATEPRFGRSLTRWGPSAAR
jgi:hypothetical protein